jgi:hypothetical protein
MGTYDRQIAMAFKLIAKKGQTSNVVWQQTGSLVSDGTKPWIKTKGTVTEFPVSIAFLPASSLLAKLFAGSNIAKGGSRGLMGAVTGFVPNVADVVVRNGSAIGIESLDPLQVNEQVILWKIEFKK